MWSGNEFRRLASANDSRSFTLVEMLMVIVIIAILVGLLLPALNLSTVNAKRKQQMLDRKTISLALKSYKHEYMKWPVPDPPPCEYSNLNWKVVEILDKPTQDPNLQFLNKGSYRRDANGSLIDPWGRHYWIKFDGTNAYVDGACVDI